MRHGWILAPLLLSLASCGGGGSGPSPPLPASTYTVGGSISGLSGSGLVLQNNGANDLTVSATGSFTFSNGLTSGSSYAVTIKTRPAQPTQDCVVANGSGNVSGANIANVSISCTTSSFKIGGTVSGLSGTGLQIRNADGTTLTLAANGSFSFPNAVVSGNAYHTALIAQPSTPTQFCTASAVSGIVGGTDVNISVNCNSGTAKFLYVTDLTGNSIRGFAVNAATGALSALSGSPFATGPRAQPNITTPSGNFLYTLNEDDGTISAFAVDSTSGALTAVSGSPFKVTGTINSLVPPLYIDPSGRFLYALTTGAGTIVGYAIDPATGALTRFSGPDFSAPGAGWIGFDPLGQYLYVIGAPSGSENDVYSASIDPAKGTLSKVGTPAVIAGQSAGPLPVGLMHPSGKFLYVIRGDVVYAVSIDPATQLLSLVPSIPQLVTGGRYPRIDPSGQFLYIVNLANGLSGFQIDPTTGALTPIPGSPFAAGGDARDFDLDPLGHYLYLPALSTKLNAFGANGSTGVLTPLANSPYSVDQLPNQLRVDRSGRYLYVASFGPNTVSSFSIDSGTGALMLIGSVPAGSTASTFSVVGTQ
jgi:6-phosphogluconolactonase (cycloisomerase 2 family)